MSSLPDKTADGPLNSEKKKEAMVNGIMKIRLYPTQHQKEKLQQIFNANRYAYNKSVEVFGDRLFDLSIKPKDFKLIKDDVRRYVVKYQMRDMKSRNELNISDDIINAPDEALDSGYRDTLKARKSTIELSKSKKAKTGKGFKLKKLKFRSKKNSYSETVEIKKTKLKQITKNEDLYVRFWPEFFAPEEVKKVNPVLAKVRRTRAQIAEDKIRKAKEKEAEEERIESLRQIKIGEPLPKILFSVRLQKIKPNIYYLCIPVIKEKEPIKTDKICAIDPGVRTMLTVFDPEDKQVYMIGNNVNKLVTRSKRIDKIKSQLRNFKYVDKKKTKKKRYGRNKRYRLKKEMQFIQRKIKNMTNDMHHKTSKFLSENYKTIIYPKFNVKGMCAKKHRNIGKETVRRMYLWSHYKFRELLKYKTVLRGGKVVDCDEKYTSKTCTCCGRLNHALGASKKFKCPYCKYEVDRDIGAARNIYLKNHRLV
jgi:putative transposase